MGINIHLSDIYKKSDRPSRAGFVLESTGVIFAAGETPDHINSIQPINDSILNLRPLEEESNPSSKINLLFNLHRKLAASSSHSQQHKI
jgi:hypothetical protein